MTEPTISTVNEGLKGFTVRYSLTRADILRWNLYALRHNRTLIVYMVVLLVFSLWMNLRGGEVAAQAVGFKIFYSVVFTLGWLFFVGLLVVLMMVSMVMFKKHQGLLCEHVLEIREDGLLERTEVNESLHRWAGFHKIVSTDSYLYIYVTDNNVHMVPRKAFGSKLEERTFRDQIEQRIKAAAG